MQQRDISYEKVEVTVVSATQTRRTTGKYRSYTDDVVVEYEGKQYDLINVKSGEMIRYESLANLEPRLQYNNPYMDNTYISAMERCIPTSTEFGRTAENLTGIWQVWPVFTYLVFGI